MGYRPQALGTAPPFYASPGVLASIHKVVLVCAGQYIGYVWEKVLEVINIQSLMDGKFVHMPKLPVCWQNGDYYEY